MPNRVGNVVRDLNKLQTYERYGSGKSNELNNVTMKTPLNLKKLKQIVKKDNPPMEWINH